MIDFNPKKLFVFSFFLVIAAFNTVITKHKIPITLKTYCIDTPIQYNEKTFVYKLLVKEKKIGPKRASLIVNYLYEHKYIFLRDLRKITKLSNKNLKNILTKVLAIPNDKVITFEKKYNLNKVNFRILSKIISEEKAYDLITIRKKLGNFKNFDELKFIPKFSNKTIKKLKRFFYIN